MRPQRERKQKGEEGMGEKVASEQQSRRPGAEHEAAGEGSKGAAWAGDKDTAGTLQEDTKPPVQPDMGLNDLQPLE